MIFRISNSLFTNGQCVHFYILDVHKSDFFFFLFSDVLFVCFLHLKVRRCNKMTLWWKFVFVWKFSVLFILRFCKTVTRSQPTKQVSISVATQGKSLDQDAWQTPFLPSRHQQQSVSKLKTFLRKQWKDYFHHCEKSVFHLWLEPGVWRHVETGSVCQVCLSVLKSAISIKWIIIIIIYHWLV